MNEFYWRPLAPCRVPREYPNVANATRRPHQMQRHRPFKRGRSPGKRNGRGQVPLLRRQHAGASRVKGRRHGSITACDSTSRRGRGTNSPTVRQREMQIPQRVPSAGRRHPVPSAGSMPTTASASSASDRGIHPRAPQSSTRPGRDAARSRTRSLRSPVVLKRAYRIRAKSQIRVRLGRVLNVSHASLWRLLLAPLRTYRDFRDRGRAFGHIERLMILWSGYASITSNDGVVRLHSYRG